MTLRKGVSWKVAILLFCSLLEKIRLFENKIVLKFFYKGMWQKLNRNIRWFAICKSPIIHLVCRPKLCMALSLISPGYYSVRKRNKRQCLCKILEGEKVVLWEMCKWRMAHFRNAKSLFIAARTGAQLFMRFTWECELIVCTKGCEPGLAFKKRVKAIRECLLKRVCFWVPHFILPVLGERSGSKHSDLTDFKRFTFPFFLSFSVIFFILQTLGKLYRNLS